MKQRIMFAAPAALVLVALAACAPSTATHPAAGGEAGFFKGLWHGFTLLFTFVVSLFRDGVGIYEAHNNGNLYNLGYLLGVMMFFGGGCGGACKTRVMKNPC